MRNNYDKRSSLKELANCVALLLASVEVLGLSLGQSHDDFEYVPDSLHYSAHLFEDFFTLHLETDMFLEAFRDQVTVMSLQVQHTHGL